MRAAALALAAIAALAFPASAAAHVLLSPNTVAPHSFMLYTVLSPNERDSPLTGLSLTIPESLEVDAVADTPGFTESELTDQSHRIVGLRWSGGRVAPEARALPFHGIGRGRRDDPPDRGADLRQRHHRGLAHPADRCRRRRRQQRQQF